MKDMYQTFVLLGVVVVLGTLVDVLQIGQIGVAAATMPARSMQQAVPPAPNKIESNKIESKRPVTASSARQRAAGKLDRRAMPVLALLITAPFPATVASSSTPRPQ
jgi:hypothetical protein